MVFFGTSEKEVKSGKISNVICDYCQENVNMYYTITSRYFHLYFVPLFPFKRNTVLACESCETVFISKRFSTIQKSKLQRENELKPARNPVWMYSGVLLLTLLIPLAFLQSKKADEKKLEYKNNPMIGDVYFLSLPNKYTTMKIAAVDKDSVHFIMNDTSVSKFTKVFGINDDNNYTTSFKSYSKKEITWLLEHDSIYSIDRKK